MFQKIDYIKWNEAEDCSLLVEEVACTRSSTIQIFLEQMNGLLRKVYATGAIGRETQLSVAV